MPWTRFLRRMGGTALRIFYLPSRFLQGSVTSVRQEMRALNNLGFEQYNVCVEISTCVTGLDFKKRGFQGTRCNLSHLSHKYWRLKPISRSVRYTEESHTIVL